MAILKSKTTKSQEIYNQGLELSNSTNFNKLKKYALDNKIEILDSDKSSELCVKIKSFIEGLEIDKEKSHVFTYAPHSCDSQRYINFMGKQEFIEARPVTIIDNPSNESLICKLKGHPLFIEGVHSEEEIKKIISNKQKAEKERVAKVRREDSEIQSSYRIMQQKLN